MDNVPNKNEITSLVLKILPPFLLSVMAKIASSYKKGKRISFLSNIVVVCLAACGSIVGYWITQYLHWEEYKMTLTIFFFGLFSDKLFEFLFSKTLVNSLLNHFEDIIKEQMELLLRRLNNKK